MLASPRRCPKFLAMLNKEAKEYQNLRLTKLEDTTILVMWQIHRESSLEYAQFSGTWYWCHAVWEDDVTKFGYKKNLGYEKVA